MGRDDDRPANGMPQTKKKVRMVNTVLGAPNILKLALLGSGVLP